MLGEECVKVKPSAGISLSKATGEASLTSPSLANFAVQRDLEFNKVLFVTYTSD